MKARGFIGMVVVMLVVSAGSALAGAPVAVSPGSGSGMAIITQECPTFSWSQVEGAVSYRVKVFEMVTGEIRSYGDMETMGEAIIEAEIGAPALSWTPSMDQGLVSGKRYVWYVEAITGTKDPELVEGWSEGKSFGVNPGLSLGTKEVVEGAVREYLSTEWVKSESYKELTSVLTTEVTKGGGTITDQSTPPKPQGSEAGSNTLYGKDAGFNLGDDDDEATFIGYQAGYNTNDGTSGNTFVGYRAGYINTTGTSNTFLGYHAGYSNTTAFANTFIGMYAGFSNITGYENTFLGVDAGFMNTTGSFNTFIGRSAGYYNTAGSNNVFLGYRAGQEETGSCKLYIHNSQVSDPLIYGEFDNRILKINGALTATSVTAVSDVSFKKEIRPLTSSLEKVSGLQGVTEEWKTEEYPEKGFTKERQIGLIAQEVEPLLPELVHTDTEGKKSLSYDKLTAVLVEAIKEQQGQIEKQRDLAQRQQAKIEQLEAVIQKMRDEMR